MRVGLLVAVFRGVLVAGLWLLMTSLHLFELDLQYSPDHPIFFLVTMFLSVAACWAVTGLGVGRTGYAESLVMVASFVCVNVLVWLFGIDLGLIQASVSGILINEPVYMAPVLASDLLLAWVLSPWAEPIRVVAD